MSRTGKKKRKKEKKQLQVWLYLVTYKKQGFRGVVSGARGKRKFVFALRVHLYSGVCPSSEVSRLLHNLLQSHDFLVFAKEEPPPLVKEGCHQHPYLVQHVQERVNRVAELRGDPVEKWEAWGSRGALGGAGGSGGGGQRVGELNVRHGAQGKEKEKKTKGNEKKKETRVLSDHLSQCRRISINDKKSNFKKQRKTNIQTVQITRMRP